MRLLRSARRPGRRADAALLQAVEPLRLRAWVEQVAVPRHAFTNHAENQRVAGQIGKAMERLGYRVESAGMATLLAAPPALGRQPAMLLAAHYDSVPETPGADDNASGVAALLEAARVLAARPELPPVRFAFFNCEEDGLLGSRDFAADASRRALVTAAHVLEMVGFRSHEPGSQTRPLSIPVALPDRGDFLGLLANAASEAALDRVLAAADDVPDLPVIGLRVDFGLERVLPVLNRSDHAPFWRAGVPAVMWTDTSEFRNPHYHRPTDTPDTLDYDFLAAVTRLVVALAAG